MISISKHAQLRRAARDEHWSGSGLWRILFNLDWSRTV